MTDLFKQAQPQVRRASMDEYGTRWTENGRVNTRTGAPAPDRREALTGHLFDLMAPERSVSTAEREAMRSIFAEQPVEEQGNWMDFSDDQLQRAVALLRFTRTYAVPDYIDHFVKHVEGGMEPMPFRQWMDAA